MKRSEVWLNWLKQCYKFTKAIVKTFSETTKTYTMCVAISVKYTTNFKSRRDEHCNVDNVKFARYSLIKEKILLLGAGALHYITNTARLVATGALFSSDGFTSTRNTVIRYRGSKIGKRGKEVPVSYHEIRSSPRSSCCNRK